MHHTWIYFTVFWHFNLFWIVFPQNFDRDDLAHSHMVHGIFWVKCINIVWLTRVCDFRPAHSRGCYLNNSLTDMYWCILLSFTYFLLVFFFLLNNLEFLGLTTRTVLFAEVCCWLVKVFLITGFRKWLYPCVKNKLRNWNYSCFKMD